MSAWLNWLADPKSNRAWIFIFSGLFLIETFYMIDLFPIIYPWQEMLLNYRGGFIRRGLLGEIGLLGRPYAAEVLYGLIFAAYTAFVALFIRFVRKIDNPTAQILILLSPMMLSYPIIFPSVGLRKDVFVLLAFAYAMTTSCQKRAFVAMFIATFIHEEALFFVPMVVMKHPKTLFYFLIFAAVFTALTALPKPVAEDIAKSWNADLGLPVKYITGEISPFTPSPRYVLADDEYGKWLDTFLRKILPLSIFGLILTMAPIFWTVPIRALKKAKVAALFPILLFAMPNWGRWESHWLLFLTISAVALNNGEKISQPPKVLFLFLLFCIYPYTDVVFDENRLIFCTFTPIFVLVLMFFCYIFSCSFTKVRQWNTLRRSDS